MATAIGTPSWEPKDFTIVVAPIGDPVDPSPFFASIDRLFGDLHHWDMKQGLLAPSMPHDGPYDNELSRLAEASGFERTQSISAWDFAAPGGVILAFALVPTSAAPVGRSTDDETDVIIPNASFPITLDGDMWREGEPYDLLFDGTFPGFDQWMPPIDAEGMSHYFFIGGENDSLATIPGIAREGSYELRLTITDSTGAGWMVLMPFTVTPPPNPGCDDMGDHHNFSDALPLEMGSLIGRVCDFGDMFRIGGMGARRVTLRSDPAMGNLEMAVFSATGDGTLIRMTKGASASEELMVMGGEYVQVFGVGAMGAYQISVL